MLPLDASEADMTCRGVDRFGMSSRWPIAAAVVRRTKVRAAFQDLAWNAYPRLAGIVALILARPARVLWDAARLRRVGRVLRHIPVGGPLPHVADHVEEPVAVRRERAYGRGALIPIKLQVLVRKIALPGVGHLPVARRELVAPGELRAFEPATRGELPLGFGRQAPCRPTVAYASASL